jgi:leader peptidase (prepilin peptidase)/N-methyltransferase
MSSSAGWWKVALPVLLMLPHLTNSQSYTILAFAFAIGACIGSFLNVVIYRLPIGISLHNPKRSFCPLCKAQIPLWYNLPLLGWLILRGKCANCKAPISVRYPIVELLTGLLFVAVTLHCFLVAGNPYLIVPYWILLSLFVAGTYIDLDHYILPDEITLGGTVVGLVCSAVVPEFLFQMHFDAMGMHLECYEKWWQNLAASAAGAALGYGLLWLVVELGKKLFGKRTMKFEPALEWSIGQEDGAEEPCFTLDGDASLWTDLFFRKSDRLIISCPRAEIDGVAHEHVTLTIKAEGVTIQPADATAAPTELNLEQVQHMKGQCHTVVIPREAMGLGDVKFMALVGAFLGWQGVLFTVFSASIVGSVIALALILLRKREWAQRIPFGPYLAVGATLFMFYGPQLIGWYFHFSQRE